MQQKGEVKRLSGLKEIKSCKVQVNHTARGG